MFCVFGLQHCKIYLCATKNDLVQGDRSLRKIDFHDAQDFAEGICGSDVPTRFFPPQGRSSVGAEPLRLIDPVHCCQTAPITALTSSCELRPSEGCL